jgi:DNA excision repair protein ERCC-3
MLIKYVEVKYFKLKVITGLPPKGPESEHLVYGTKAEQMKLLNDVLLVTETDFDEDIRIADDVEQFQRQQTTAAAPKKKAKRVESSNVRSLSGADNMAYIEYSRDETKQTSKAAAERHKLFKKYLGK